MDVFTPDKRKMQEKMKKLAEFYKISVEELETMYRNMEARREAEELHILKDFK